MLEDDEFRAFLKALGARIRQVRKEKNLDMRHIMITSGYYDAQWRKYETGGSLNVQSLLKIALTLDVPLNELFDGLGQWPRLSVGEIEKARGAALNSSKQKAEQLSTSEAKKATLDKAAAKTAPQNRAKKPNKSLQITAPAKTQSTQDGKDDL